MARKRSTLHKVSRHAAYAFVGIGLFLALIIIALVIARPSGTAGTEAANVIVSPNAGPQEIVGALENQGYIKDPFVFRIAVAIAGLFRNIRAGGYYLTENMSDWDIFKTLDNPSLRYVAIAPGLRKQEIADKVGNALDWDTVEKRELVNVNLDLDTSDLEGKYFPGTYLFPANATPKQVGSMMVANYDKELAALQKQYPNSKINFDTALLIASIIQREAAGPQDMRLISGIIWNRIFDGMDLDIDATVQYARGKTADGWWAPISSSDIKDINSPYNTYENNGLPPTPISNPGPDAIEAALNPQKTDCLYYLHDSNHQIHCSTTYAGQLKNIQTYLK